MSRVLAAIVTEEDGSYVATNPDTGVASQGQSLEEALANLTEAVSLYLEEAATGNKHALKLNQHPFLTTITV